MSTATELETLETLPRVREEASPAWQARFLAALASSANVSAAAKASGASRATAYRIRGQDRDFAAAWDQALEEAVDELELEARRRAVEGVERIVYHKGVECGRVREYSDTLLMFLLRAHRPEKYRDNVAIATGDKSIEVRYIDRGNNPRDKDDTEVEAMIAAMGFVKKATHSPIETGANGTCTQ